MKLTVRLKHVQVLAVLLICLAFAHACHTFLLICLAFAHACCLTHSAKQNGLRNAPFLFRRGSGSPLARSQWPCGYRTWWIHFGLVRFFMAIPTENEGTGERGERRERRTESAARRKRAFARTYWLCRVFRGESVGGCAPPNLRQRAIGSLDSLHLIRGVGALYAAKGTRR